MKGAVVEAAHSDSLLEERKRFSEKNVARSHFNTNHKHTASPYHAPHDAYSSRCHSSLSVSSWKVLLVNFRPGPESTAVFLSGC